MLQTIFLFKILLQSPLLWSCTLRVNVKCKYAYIVLGWTLSYWYFHLQRTSSSDKFHMSFSAKNLIQVKPKKRQLLSSPLSTGLEGCAPSELMCTIQSISICLYTFHTDLFKMGLFSNFFFWSHQFLPEILFKNGIGVIKRLKMQKSDPWNF